MQQVWRNRARDAPRFPNTLMSGKEYVQAGHMGYPALSTRSSRSEGRVGVAPFKAKGTQTRATVAMTSPFCLTNT